MAAEAPLASLGPIDLLRTVPQFRRFWYAQIVSELGDWFQIVALLTLLPTTGGKSHVVAGYLVLRLIPMVVWSPIAGVVADKYDRGKVLIVTDLLRAIVVLCYPLVIRSDGSTNVVLLYVLSFTQESLSAFFEPARGAVLPQIVPTRGLLAANALSGATWSAMLALGAALGGLVTRKLGRDAAYVIDACSFLLSAAFVISARLPKLPPEHPHEEGAEPRPSALREGYSYLRTHRAQAVAACLKGGWGLVGGVVVLFTAFADQIFSIGNAAAAATALGILYAGRGLGAFSGPFIARQMAGETVRGLSRALLVAFPCAALGYLGFAFAPNVWIAALAIVLAHCGGSTVWVHSTQLLQITVPNRLLGRVVAVEWALLTFTMGASTMAVSALLDVAHWTPRTAALAVALVPVAVALTWGALRRRVGADLERDAAKLAQTHARAPARR